MRTAALICTALLLGCGPLPVSTAESTAPPTFDFEQLAKEALAQPSTWWLPTTNDEVILVNLANSQEKSASQKTAWTSIFFRSAQRDSFGKSYTSARTLTLYDCSAKKTALVQNVTFGADGSQQGSLQNDEANLAMENVVPGTTGEQVFSFICDPLSALKGRNWRRVDEEFRVRGQIRENAYATYIFNLKHCPDTPSVTAPEATLKAWSQELAACSAANQKLLQSLISD